MKMELTEGSETSAYINQTPGNYPKGNLLYALELKIKLISGSNFCVGRDSSVGIATHFGLNGPGIESRWGARFSAPVKTGPGAHPAPYTTGTGSFSGVKRPGRGVDHPPHLAPRLKKKYSYTSTPPTGASWPVLG